LRYHYHDSIPWWVWLFTVVMWLADLVRQLGSRDVRDDYPDYEDND